MAKVGQPDSVLCGCAWQKGLERGQCPCLASGGVPGTCRVSSHLTHSLYGTGTLSAVALVLTPRVGGFRSVVRPCGPFSGSLLKIQQFLLPPQSPLIFTVEVMRISLPHGGYWPGLGLGLPIPPLLLLLLHASPSVLPSPLHLHVSAPPTCQDECSFFKHFIVRLPYSSIF
jgi:hypothetical protein